MKKEPTLVELVRDSAPKKRAWTFTAAQQREIEGLFAAMRRGEIPPMGFERIAAVIKAHHKLRWSVSSILSRLREIHAKT